MKYISYICKQSPSPRILTLILINMEKPIIIEKVNHTIQLTDHKVFVEAMVLLSKDLYRRLTMKSTRVAVPARPAYERAVYCDLAQRLFNEKVPYLHLFSSPKEMSDFKKAHGIDVTNNDDNGWFKNVCLDISKQHPKDEILAYIRKKSNEFEKVEYILPNP